MTPNRSGNTTPVLPILIGGVLIVVGGLLISQLAPLAFPTQASAEAESIDTLFTVMLGIGGAIFLLVQGILLYSVIRFRARPDDLEDGPSIHGNTTLELVWTAVPAVIVFFLAIYSYSVWVDIRQPRDNEVNVRAIGQRFAWTFEYDDPTDRVDEVIRSNILHTYPGQPLVMQLEAVDVNHAFWVPEMRIKQDLLVGRVTEMRVTPQEPGTYRVVCAELCGSGHGQMWAQIIVHENEEQYLTSFIDPAVELVLNPPADPVARGRSTINNYACASCHVLDDLGWVGNQGPSLNGIGDTAARRRSGFTAAEYIVNSIRHPNEYIVPGFSAGIMPQFGPTVDPVGPVEGASYQYMSNTDLYAITAYLCTITGDGEPGCTPDEAQTAVLEDYPDAPIDLGTAAEATEEVIPEGTPEFEVTPNPETTEEGAPPAEFTPVTDTTPEAESTPEGEATPEGTAAP